MTDNVTMPPQSGRAGGPRRLNGRVVALGLALLAGLAAVWLLSEWPGGPTAEDVGNVGSESASRRGELTKDTGILEGTEESAARAAAAPWRMFRGDPACTGAAVSPLPARLSLLWSREAGGPVKSTAAIVGDTVYVGTDNSEVLALALADGAVRWRYAAAGAVSSSPCVVGGRVFVGDQSGMFHAVDVETGQKVWTYQTGGPIHSSPTSAGGLVLFGSDDTSLHCLSNDRGALKWTVETDGRVYCPPSVVGSEVLISGCDGMLRTIDLYSGRQAQAVDLESYVVAAPARVDDRVYLPTMNGLVLCAGLIEQRVLWTWSPDESSAAFYASAGVAGGRVVAADQDGNVRCFDARDGSPRWTFTASDEVNSSPVIVGRRAFVGSDDGNLYALALDTGDKLWTFAAGAALSASPAVGHGRLVIGAEDGALYCFGPEQSP